jgi:Tol biopolymer transport system component
LIVNLIALSAVQGVASGAEAATTNDWIAFVNFPPGGHISIYTIRTDGTGGKFRTTGSAPGWSPDGYQIAFVSPAEDLQGTIRIRGVGMAVDTGVAAQGSDVSTGRVDWSPDGTKLVYGYRTEVWVMNATPPYDPVQLTSSPCGSYSPTWSPKSTQIAYIDGCSQEIHVMNADGTGKMPLPNPLGLDEGWPDWSPDGKQFAFLAYGRPGGLWVMNSDGSDQRFLAETLQFCCGSPDWSPDGTRIAFVKGLRIDVINADGTGQTTVPTPSVAQEPRWRTRLP